MNDKLNSKNQRKLSAQGNSCLTACRSSHPEPLYFGGNTMVHKCSVWVKNRIKKEKRCSVCGATKNIDLANISGEYKRDINDYEWLCRKCHVKKDGRYEKLIACSRACVRNDASYASIHRYVQNRKLKPDRCSWCNKETDYLDLANMTGEYTRNPDDYEYICRRCHMKIDGRLKKLIERNMKLWHTE